MSGTGLNLKKTFILALVLIALVGWYYFYEIEHVSKLKEQEESAKKLFHFDKDKVTQLRVLAEGEETFLKNVDNRWEITEPVEARADKNIVEAIITNLHTTKLDKVVNETPEDLKPFGLDPPRIQIGFKVEGSDKENIINVGDEDPIKTGLYAKFQDQPKVFLISRGVDYSFKKNTFDLRDKKVIDFEIERVNQVSLKKDKFESTVKKKEKDLWKITQPVSARADKNLIRQLLNQFKNLRAKKYVEEKEADLKPYGLTKPRYIIKLMVGDDNASKTLLIGSESKDPEGVYIKRAFSPKVMVVDNYFLEKIPGDILALRDKKIFKMDRQSVQLVELKYPGETIRVEKQQPSAKNENVEKSISPKEQWKIVKPRKIQADEYAMSIFLSDLDRVLAKNFIDKRKVNRKKMGFDNPSLKIIVQEKNVPEQKILVVGKKKQDENLYYGSSSIDDVYFLIDDKDLKNIRKNVFDFRDKVVFQFQRNEVKKITFRFPDRKLVIKVDGKKYELLEPKKLKLSNVKVDDLLWSIDRIEMDSIVESPGTNLEVYGLSKPTVEIQVEKNNGEIVGPLLLGKPLPEDSTSVYAKLKNDKEIFTVKKAIFDDVNIKPKDLQ